MGHGLTMRISSRRLGEFLVARRVLSRDALDELLAREARDGVHLSNLLMIDQLVSEQDLMAAVASELGVPYVDLVERSILPDVWGLVPEAFARRHLAVVLERRTAGLLVAMEDPGDEPTVAALAELLGVPILPAVAVRADLLALVEQIYGVGQSDGSGSEEAGAPTFATAAPGSSGLQLNDLLDQVLATGGSDLHLTVGAPPAVRVQGELCRMANMAPLNGSEVRRLVLGMFTEKQRERFLAEGELATSHAIPGRGRFRVSAFVQRDSVGAVLRLVPAEIPSAEDLGLPADVIRWADHTKGLVLVCGPHGSGTSTTMASLVDRINRARACHILTVEQPIEFLHKHRAAIVNQREVGEDTATFESGLRYSLRQDPDVLVVGEIPDVATVRHVLAAAETGHLVMATLRTLDTVKTLERLVDIFPTDQQVQVRHQLATTLRGIVVQQLVPAIDGGFALATEVMKPTAEVVRCIREGDHGSLVKAMLGGPAMGMGTMDQSLAQLVIERQVTVSDAADRAVDPNELRYLTSGLDA
ncbi:MAG: PilT/PilU family type 4a pilus ATPase [Acidimicrobiia bacterium]|nr:PilT/PilU family type 4a pilus ATPase [Acidimicrobiia bacterium]